MGTQREDGEQVKVQSGHGSESEGGNLLFREDRGCLQDSEVRGICSGGWGRAVSGQALGTLVPEDSLWWGMGRLRLCRSELRQVREPLHEEFKLMDKVCAPQKSVSWTTFLQKPDKGELALL